MIESCVCKKTHEVKYRERLNNKSLCNPTSQYIAFSNGKRQSMTNDFVIEELESTKDIPYELLLIADPSKDNIDRYIFNSAVYTIEYTGRTIGCCVLYPVIGETFEIKNIVIDEKYQGKGLGTILLNHTIGKAKWKGAKRVIIGTGNSSIGPLYLYQKIGFKITGIKVDFFRENYQEQIIENGIECRDLILLTKEL